MILMTGHKWTAEHYEKDNMIAISYDSGLLLHHAMYFSFL